jgi:hypothetical protein
VVALEIEVDQPDGSVRLFSGKKGEGRGDAGYALTCACGDEHHAAPAFGAG